MNEGERLRRARPAPAGRRSPRRRSSPATCCSPSTSGRGCTSATSRPPARSSSSAGPRRAGVRRHRRGHPAPPAAHRRAGRAATTRSTRSTRRCAPQADVEALRDGAGRRHDRRGRHRPRAARRSRTRTASGRPRAPGHARPGDGAVGRASPSDGRRPACSTGRGVADRMSVAPGPHRPAGRPRPADRGGRAGQPRRWSTRRRAGRSSRPALASQEPQHPLRRARAARPGRRTFLRGRADGARREALA